MCPEKERFMRETRKQLSVFEVIPDTEMVTSFILLHIQASFLSWFSLFALFSRCIHHLLSSTGMLIHGCNKIIF